MAESDNDDFEVLNRVLLLLKPLSRERRQRIVNLLDSLVNVDNFAGRQHQLPAVARSHEVTPSVGRVPFSEDLPVPPKRFFLEKQPRTDVERVACLAYYLTHYRDTPHFKTIDLSKLNTESECCWWMLIHNAT